ELLFAVAILDEDSRMIGSMLVVDLASRQKVDEWLQSEPYVTANVWENIEVLPCRVGPSFVSKIE
ncbi:MAG TPA: YciI family protein, partial [Anaerolineales bacterium]|nr:YciI family protein [Anaerolineales bacterium]